MTRNLQDCPNKNDQYDHWLLGPRIHLEQYDIWSDNPLPTFSELFFFNHYIEEVVFGLRKGQKFARKVFVICMCSF